MTIDAEAELHQAKARIARLEATVRDAMPLLSLYRTHLSVASDGAYSGRTLAMCEELIDRIENDEKPGHEPKLVPESFIIARELLEQFISLDSRWGMNEGSFGQARSKIQKLITSSIPVDAPRVDACLAACEGIDTEWLQRNPDEANIRLRGERERRLREVRAAAPAVGNEQLKDEVLRDIVATLEDLHGEQQLPGYTFLPRAMRLWYEDLRPTLHKAAGIVMEPAV